MRIFFLTHRLPFRQDRGDRIRAYQILRRLAAEHEVELFSLVHDEAEAADAPGLASELGIRVTPLGVPYLRNRVLALAAFPGPRPLTHLLLNSPDALPQLRTAAAERPPDLVLAYCSGMAQFGCRAPLDQFPLVVDFVDVDSCKWQALSSEAPRPARWVYRREARTLGAFEAAVARRAAVALVVNEREAAALRRLQPAADVRVIRNGVDLEDYASQAGPVDDPRLVFAGVMNYTPNVQGVLWFVREVWPEVRRHHPLATFTIVGSDPTDEIRRLQSAADGIAVTGRVPDVAPYLWEAAINLAPLPVARGIQNKVLQALAAGLPSVVTSAVFEGLPSAVQRACLVGHDSTEFAAHVVTLLKKSGAERRAMAATADLSVLSWDIQLAPLHRIIHEAAGFVSSPLADSRRPSAGAVDHVHASRAEWRPADRQLHRSSR